MSVQSTRAWDEGNSGRPRGVKEAVRRERLRLHRVDL